MGDRFMYYNFAKRLFVGLTIGFFTVSVIFTLGCTAKKIKVVYDTGDNSGYSVTGHEHKKEGPPPHAPAHGYRAKHHYRYYPECSVYYDNERKLYFYIKGDHWEVSVSLPSHLRIRLGNSVSIELDTDRPYLYHAEHVKKYPPGQLKKKHKKKPKWG
jgi:hypothetical protein